MRPFLWLFSLFCFALHANEEEFVPPEDAFSSSLVSTQSLLSTTINSVSVISGEWIDSETDFVVVGPEPLILNRSYSGNKTHSDKLGYNWDFNRPQKLIIDSSDSGNHHGDSKLV